MTDEGAKKQKRPWLHWLFTVFLAMTISILSLYVYDAWFAPKIVTVDFKAYLEGEKKRYLSGEIDDAALEENMERFQQKIKSLPKNTTVLIEEVVVSDAETLRP